MMMARRRGSDEFSDTTSELASAIHSSFASQPQTTTTTARDSTMAQAAGGGGGAASSKLSKGNINTNNNPSMILTSTAEDETNQTRNKTLLLVAIVAIVIAIAGAFLSTRGSRDRTTDRPSTVVDQVIQEVSSNAALRDTDSPQYRAREWMITVDQMTSQIVAEGIPRIHQRYALATLYFATQGGTKWDRSVRNDEATFQFVNPTTSECQWFGVVCASDQEQDDTTTRRRLQDTAPIIANLNSTVFGLIMPNRNLTGILPPELGTVTSLRRIDLSSNQLSQTIPDAIVRNMKDLWWLDLSDNRFTGSIPKSLWRLPKLSHLFLFRNQLSGRIEREPLASPAVSTMSSMTEDTVPPLKPLVQVYLYENQLTGPMPLWFHELNGLEDWVSYKNQLSGPLPQVLPEKLSFYDLSYNRFAGTLPTSLWAEFPPPPLETLYLEHNQITGAIPNTTQPQPLLKLVSIHNNRLSGRIPEGFAIAWTNLKELRLQNNTLEGAIPPTFWRNPRSPAKLTHLNLSFNRFSGTLPNSTQLRNLQEVRLHQNPALRGTIPDGFGYLWPNVTALEIQGTSLEGQLGPIVVVGTELTKCPEIWPRYSEAVTSFRVSANCFRRSVDDPEPPVQCYCCTHCVAVK